MATHETKEINDINETLTQWLATKIEGAANLSVDDLAIAGAAGFSAETLFFTANWQADGQKISQDMVLRKQVLGHDLIHQPELEFQARVMDQLSQRDLSAPVPELIGLENDASLLGAPFLVMKRLSGSIAPQNPNYNIAGWVAELPLHQRADAWNNGVRALASVHALEYSKDFEFMARGKEPGLSGYISWLEDWVKWAVAGRDFPVGEAALAYLKKEMPTDAALGIVWGDGQPSNILYNEQTAEVTGLLDWELATLGPGEIDLAWWLMFDELFSDWLHVPRLEGLPTKDEIIATYEQASGRKVGDLSYYDVIACLRMAIVTMRAVDRQVAQGRYKADNVAWSDNAFTTQLAVKISAPPIETSADYIDFTMKLMAKD